MAEQRILLVEDDPGLGSVLRDYLTIKGYEVELATDGEIGLRLAKRSVFDACVLDVMLPLKDGFELATQIREFNKRVPIIFVTAKADLEDKAAGYAAGADDYLTKPFRMEELTFRLNAILKRTNPAANDETKQFTIGGFVFDYERRNLTFNNEPEPVRLSSKEADLLRLLCLHEKQVLRREVALRQIWGEDTYHNARSMDVFITRLRKLLAADPSVEIMNVHSTGYKLLTP
jgi:DNA-binding response OmpR family regulator